MRPRIFFNLLVLLILSSCVSGVKLSRLNLSFKTHPLSIIQGSTDKDETYIAVVSIKPLYPLTYEVSEVEEPQEPKDPQESQKPQEPKESKEKNTQGKKGKKGKKNKAKAYYKKTPLIVKSIWSPQKNRVIDHLHIEGLSLKTLYKLRVKHRGRVIDERTFQAFNPKKSRPRIGVVSCMDDRFKEESKAMWTSYLNKFVDINFFIGDNVYADYDGEKFIKDGKTSFHQLWRRYGETFDRLYIYHNSDLKPTLALWDDHDYGVNNGGAGYRFKQESLKVFNAFFPRYKVEGFEKTNFGAGSKFEAYGQKFLFLDGRFYREVNRQVNRKIKKASSSHLGKEQLSFLVKELKKSKKPVWLIKGDQFFGGYHPFESYEGHHLKEFKSLMASIEKAKTPVLFVSGDRHLGEIMKIKKSEFNFNSYEITSSGIHAKVFKDSFKRTPNPRQIVGKSGAYNYTVIEILNKKKYKVTSYGEKNWSHYSKELVL